jgi:hypothetical protein
VGKAISGIKFFLKRVSFKKGGKVGKIKAKTAEKQKNVF